jgi:hypothetical protein
MYSLPPKQEIATTFFGDMRHFLGCEMVRMDFIHKKFACVSASIARISVDYEFLISWIRNLSMIFVPFCLC